MDNASETFGGGDTSIRAVAGNDDTYVCVTSADKEWETRTGGKGIELDFIAVLSSRISQLAMY